MWLLVVLLTIGLSVKEFAQADVEAPHTLPVSAPDIYPDSGSYDGQVDVQIVAQAPDADIYYTLDGTHPTRGGKSSKLYVSGFPIFEIGYHIVMAVAIPSIDSQDHRVESVVRNQTYTIKPTGMAHPVAHPTAGHFKGEVSVQLDFAAPLLAQEHDNVVIQYCQKDATDHGNAFSSATDTWTTYKNKYNVKIEHVGLHYLFVRSFSNGNQSSSPMARYMYYVEPAVVYDLSTECSICSGDHEKPIAGEKFTVSIQNANRGSLMFLSYREGCGESYKVEGTEKKTVTRHRVAKHFMSPTAASEVFVCVSDGGSEPFKAIPRRLRVDKFFKVERRPGDSAPLPPPPPGGRKDSTTTGNDVVLNYGNNNGPQYHTGNDTQEGMGSLSLILLWLVAVGLIGGFIKYSRNPNSGIGGGNSNSPSRNGGGGSGGGDQAMEERRKINV